MGISFNPLIFSGLVNIPGAGAVTWRGSVPTEGDLPVSGNALGDSIAVQDTGKIYVWSGAPQKWHDTGITMAAFGNTPNADGASIITDDTNPLIRKDTLVLQPADATNPGAVSTTTQTFAGDKTFTGLIDAQGGVDSSTNTLTIGATADFINIGGAGATITINGDTTYEHVTDLVVKDKTITLNDGGGLASGDNSGIEVEENAVITGYVQVSADRNSWELKAPNQAGVAVIDAGVAGITIDQSSHDLVSLAAVGSTPNADGATLTGQVLNLEPADDLNPGVVSTTTQTFAGDKTFNDSVAFVDVIDVQTGIDSTTGTLTLGGINTTTVNIGEPATGISSAVFHGPTDHNGYAITNFGNLSTNPTASQAVVTTVTSSSVNPDYTGLIFSETAPEQGDILYTAGGTLTLNSTQNLALNSVNILVSGANVDIGEVAGTTDIVGTVTIEYNPADPTDWAPAPTHVIEAIDQLAERFVEQDQVTKEPTGFVNRTSSTLSFTDSSPARTFTITPVGSFDFYVKGKKFTKSIISYPSGESIQISATAGDHYIYYDDTGVLQESTDPNFVKTIIQEYAYVAVIYWNTDTNTHTYFGDERHGLVMDGVTHGYLHTVFGARFLSGLALQNFNISTGYFNSDQGTIRDEDIVHTISNTVLSGIPILYRENSQWRKKPAGAYPLIYPGSLVGYVGETIPYNQYTGGSWQLTAVQNTKYVLIHFFATNDLENGVIGIQGIAEYNSIETARTAANTEITSLSGLPFTEFVPIGTVLFQTNSGSPSPTKGNIIVLDGANYIDFRGTQLYTPAGTATTHGLLSGLGNDDHFQYLLADGTRAMGGALDMGTHQINNVVNPVSAQDAATKNYVDGKVADSIIDNVTTIAPSQNAVFDALALKQDTGNYITALTGEVTASGPGSVAATIAANAVTNSKLAQMPASTLKGNNTGLTADPTDLSASDVRTLLSVLPSYAGDIQTTTFVALDNTTDYVTDLAFANGTVRGFDVILTVERDTTYAEYSLKGIQKGASWEMSQEYVGDETGLTFSITSLGEIQYTSTNTTFNATVRFRALSV